MFHKHHFYNILAYISVFGVFFLNYFDKTYMKFVLINLGISVILDLVWMIVSANVVFEFIIGILVSEYLNPTLDYPFWFSEVHRHIYSYNNDNKVDNSVYPF